MAKKKVTGFYREVASESLGVFTWETNTLVWRYTSGMGINLFVTIDGAEHPFVYAKNLVNAGLLAEGVEAGMEMQRRIDLNKKEK